MIMLSEYRPRIQPGTFQTRIMNTVMAPAIPVYKFHGRWFEIAPAACRSHRRQRLESYSMQGMESHVLMWM